MTEKEVRYVLQCNQIERLFKENDKSCMDVYIVYSSYIKRAN